MESFKENKYFINLIQKNDDIFAIKSALEGFIIHYRGNKKLCDAVIKYAMENSSFKWEEDDKRSSYRQFSNKKDEYYFEKERLVQNFTKERYEKVLILCREYLKIREEEIAEEKRESISNRNEKIKESRKVKETPKQSLRGKRKSSENKTTLCIFIAAIILFFLIKFFM